MNITKAFQISTHLGNMARIASAYAAKYGDARITEASSGHAKELYSQFMAEQVAIANLLDSAALKTPYNRFQRWWERRDFMNSGLLNELWQATATLIERCAYMEELNQPTEGAPSLLVIEQVIAGLLHPSTRMTEVEKTTTSEQRQAV
jgi:hypothetical protein